MPKTALPAPLGLGTRTRLRLRHTWRLGREVAHHGSEHGLWWLVPVVVLVVLVAMTLSAASSTVPVAVYTLF